MLLLGAPQDCASTHVEWVARYWVAMSLTSPVRIAVAFSQQFWMATEGQPEVLSGSQVDNHLLECFPVSGTWILDKLWEEGHSESCIWSWYHYWPEDTTNHFSIWDSMHVHSLHRGCRQLVHWEDCTMYHWGHYWCWVGESELINNPLNVCTLIDQYGSCRAVALNLKTKEPSDGAIVCDLPIPPGFLLESDYVLRVF